ncbi:hypothetical protein B0H11DRAFT_1900920 [Mycena galericulata]|nr:hypothetical protein B0H11DRAFT_1900920 [Mycena galericulata]
MRARHGFSLSLGVLLTTGIAFVVRLRAVLTRPTSVPFRPRPPPPAYTYALPEQPANTSSSSNAPCAAPRVFTAIANNGRTRSAKRSGAPHARARSSAFGVVVLGYLVRSVGGGALGPDRGKHRIMRALPRLRAITPATKSPHLAVTFPSSFSFFTCRALPFFSFSSSSLLLLLLTLRILTPPTHTPPVANPEPERTPEAKDVRHTRFVEHEFGVCVFECGGEVRVRGLSFVSFGGVESGEGKRESAACATVCRRGKGDTCGSEDGVDALACVQCRGWGGRRGEERTDADADAGWCVPEGEGEGEGDTRARSGVGECGRSGIGARVGLIRFPRRAPCCEGWVVHDIEDGGCADGAGWGYERRGDAPLTVEDVKPEAARGTEIGLKGERTRRRKGAHGRGLSGEVGVEARRAAPAVNGVAAVEERKRTCMGWILENRGRPFANGKSSEWVSTSVHRGDVHLPQTSEKMRAGAAAEVADGDMDEGAVPMSALGGLVTEQTAVDVGHIYIAIETGEMRAERWTVQALQIRAARAAQTRKKRPGTQAAQATPPAPADRGSREPRAAAGQGPGSGAPTPTSSPLRAKEAGTRRTETGAGSCVNPRRRSLHTERGLTTRGRMGQSDASTSVAASSSIVEKTLVWVVSFTRRYRAALAGRRRRYVQPEIPDPRKLFRGRN